MGMVGQVRYTVKKTVEAIVEADTEGDAVNLFAAALESGADLGPKVTYPLWSVCPVDVEAP
jgi:hypothetical protein